MAKRIRQLRCYDALMTAWARSRRRFLMLALVACHLVACQREAVEPAGAEAANPVTRVIPAIVVPLVPDSIAPVSRTRPGRPFNVVLISIDTLRADHVSAYGYARPTSPNMDALAGAGVLFERAYSHSPKTAPSHMSVMTGLLPEVHRVKNQKRPAGGERLAEEIPTLALFLREAGYRTAAFTAGGNVHAAFGFDRGFERYEHLSLDAAEIFAAGAAEISAGPKPFFLFLHTYQVHDPYLPPAEVRDLFVDEDYRGRIVADREALYPHAVAAKRTVAAEFWRRANPADPADLRHLQDLYDACIRYTDAQLGSFLEAVARAGLEDETLVVLLSDHGEEFWEHGATKHNSLFEEVLHVPLILRLPSKLAVAPTRVGAVVRLIDVLPTVLETLELPIPQHLRGRSLLTLASRQADESPRHLFAHWREFDSQALRLGRWKLIRNANWSHLFDLDSDPQERRAVELVEPTIRRQLAAQLDRLVAASRRYGDAIPRGDDQAAPMDAERQERLRALGYLE